MDKNPQLVRPKPPVDLLKFLKPSLRKPTKRALAKSRRHTVITHVKEWFMPGNKKRIVRERTSQSRRIRHFGTFRPAKKCPRGVVDDQYRTSPRYRRRHGVSE